MKGVGYILEKLIPSYGRSSLIGCLVLNCMIYWGAQRLTANAYHYDLTTNFDRSIPLVNEWVYIYFICYIFWGLNYILIEREGKEHWFRFASADMVSRMICGIFFILLPTTNVRPEIVGNDFAAWLMRFLYQADEASNLFPSIHCLVSWFCFIGIRKSKKIPLWYKIFSCVFAILVCLSTQFTKQHYFVDVIGGILLAELCYFVSQKVNVYKLTAKIFRGSLDE
ncbi:Protein of phosphatidic acid phosphatase family [Lachnospiraceae bacterium TWA4]|nr:Protein of phosphatidic acid phosphatase family [Lachnospiraceae bacterium TWA4]